jgi:hypothetical protein
MSFTNFFSKTVAHLPRFCFLYFLAGTAWADILYIDLNFTEAEINIFQKYSETTNQKLIVLPPLEKRKLYRDRGLAINKKKEELGQIDQQMIRRFGCRKTGWNSISCPASAEKKEGFQNNLATRSKIYYELEDLPSRYHNQDLEKDLLNLGDQNFSMVVFSGHHYEENRQFAGETGWIEEKALPAVFAKLQGRERVNSLILLGCNSFRKDNIAEIWLPSFPNILYIGGYLQTGYDRNDERGHAFLRKLLQQHDETIMASQIEASQQQLNKLLSVSTSPRYPWGSCLQKKTGTLLFFESKL